MLDDLAEAEEALSGARIATRTAARSTPHSFIYQDFLPALPRFLERYPQLDVELVLTDRAVNLVEEGIDCAVRAVQVPDDSTLVARRIAEWKWLACASREYLERHGRPQNPEELEHHNCIRFVSPSHGRTAAWQFEGATDVSFTPRGNLGVTSAEGAAAAAAVGIGIAQVSHVLALPGLRSGALEPLLVDWAIAGAPLQVVYPSNRYLGAKVERSPISSLRSIPPISGGRRWSDGPPPDARSVHRRGRQGRLRRRGARARPITRLSDRAHPGAREAAEDKASQPHRGASRSPRKAQRTSSCSRCSRTWKKPMRCSPRSAARPERCACRDRRCW